MKQSTIPGVLTPSEIIKDFLAAAGRIGGASRSPAKVAAGKINVRKAQVARRANAAARRAAKAAERGNS